MGRERRLLMLDQGNFARASYATYFRHGWMVDALFDELRYEVRSPTVHGYLLEHNSINYCVFPQDITAWNTGDPGWEFSGDYLQAPDGMWEALQITSVTDSKGPWISIAGYEKPLVFSAYVKASDGNVGKKCRIGFGWDHNTLTYPWASLGGGTGTLPAEWTRFVSAAFDPGDLGEENAELVIENREARPSGLYPEVEAYQGSWWGIQMEPGYWATSYIRCNGEPDFRYADLCVHEFPQRLRVGKHHWHLFPTHSHSYSEGMSIFAMQQIEDEDPVHQLRWDLKTGVGMVLQIVIDNTVVGESTACGWLPYAHLHIYLHPEAGKGLVTGLNWPYAPTTATLDCDPWEWPSGPRDWWVGSGFPALYWDPEEY